MATVGAVGGSQIDVQSLASQLVAAERASLDQQITRETSSVTTQISAIGTLMGALSQFRTSLGGLKSIDTFSTRQVVSSDPEIFTASVGLKAAPGTYSIEVEQLAKAHQISSNAFADGAAHVVGTGTLSLSLGEKSFSVQIEEGHATLADIRDAINSASDNPGIRATLIHGSDGSRLVLTSAKTGAENAISVSQSGGDGGLAVLEYSATNQANFTEIAAAQDAIVRVANATVTSATNTVDNAIDGVTLNLVAVSEDGPTTLTVSYDNAAVTKRVTEFVNAYNALIGQLSKLRSYDATTRTAGPMLGDSLLTGIENELRRTIGGKVDAAGEIYSTLASIGITTQADGKLAVDSTKLEKALNADFNAVGRLFGSEQGIGAKLVAQLDERLKSDSALNARSQSLTDRQKQLSDRKLDIDARMEARYKAYVAEFTRLDTLLSQLQVTSTYLTQQIESLGNLNKASSR
jgi:flagellar hook-associated protein 2